MAMPLGTVAAGKNAVSEVIALANEYGAEIIYVGNPVNLAGSKTQSTESAQVFARDLQLAIGDTGSVRLIDERLSTVSAQRSLHDAGRNQKSSRNVIDQAAAVIILEQALDIEKRSNNLAGIPVGEING